MRNAGQDVELMKRIKPSMKYTIDMNHKRKRAIEAKNKCWHVNGEILMCSS